MDVRWLSEHYFKQCFSSHSWIILKGGHRGLNPTIVRGVGLVLVRMKPLQDSGAHGASRPLLAGNVNSSSFLSPFPPVYPLLCLLISVSQRL